ncbi:SDR family NAD(P)-dependent oxidoreductase, partial [Roseateles sp. GG27B]
VTGAAQGIGRSVALRLAAEGARLLLVDRSELVYELRDELAATGTEVLALTADMEQSADCQQVMQAALE